MDWVTGLTGLVMGFFVGCVVMWFLTDRLRVRDREKMTQQFRKQA